MSTGRNDDTTVTLLSEAWRYLGIMKTSLCLAIVLTLASTVHAQEEKGLEELLREALFEEEASQNLPLAARGYEKLLEAYRTQREFAATALFRLAEVRRKQERPEEATKLYQRLLAEFPAHDPLARLSRENLLAMGADIPTTEKALGLLDEEAQEIERLRKVIEASPDLVSDLDKEAYAPIHRAAKKGQLRVLKFLSREHFLDVVWGYNAYPTTWTVDNFIGSLRKKLEPDPSEPVWLLTVRGRGYRLAAEA